MGKSKYQSGKYTAWVMLAWALFAVALVASFIVLKSAGVMNAPMGGYGARGLTSDQFTIVMVCAGQCLAALLLAGGFTVLNGIYEAVVEQRQPPE
ncbi:hypothetical protein HW452_05080 [Halomonas aquamarina]|uniref:Uncharacterized protein n=1 Tax=Vreelandella aquamarina TaxID=77097 RepID=A0ACC5VTP2_9GAMM|nr:hypothetical protein [Halomonas aquamarina]MBZ5486894.1 hypothetical protein [Halomonas aquamarina]